jgi:hypothetical protein
VAGLALVATSGVPAAASPGEDREQQDVQMDIMQSVVFEYADAWDDLDCARFAAVFASDGVLDFRSHPTLAAPDSLSTGRSQVRAYCETRKAALPAGAAWFHFMGNPVVTPISATKATGQSFGLVLFRTSPTATPTIGAVISYQDTYVKRNGKWMILKRVAS